MEISGSSSSNGSSKVSISTGGEEDDDDGNVFYSVTSGGGGGINSSKYNPFARYQVTFHNLSTELGSSLLPDFKNEASFGPPPPHLMTGGEGEYAPQNDSPFLLQFTAKLPFPMSMFNASTSTNGSEKVTLPIFKAATNTNGNKKGKLTGSKKGSITGNLRAFASLLNPTPPPINPDNYRSFASLLNL
ncbi:hypothetical protein Pcinc_001538 [Petrolisthes cinctipes]|uniref:Uncharacterized protein n=1 Tax=Petrolisthes cinctipes TaxID=88211 RepID=A0AAE1L4G5_PETCI|nr:hypothetical protein Pcinc_001538 [Petrolisthes cinctipes]